MTYMISVANHKGGVAKTTTVVSLGGALVELGHSVLLIDLDPQANLTLALGSDPDKVHGSISDVLLNQASLASVSRETSLPGLDLVPATSEMDLAERFLPIRQDYENILSRALGISTDNPLLTERQTNVTGYDYVIADCPPSTGAVTLNALNASNLLVIPTQPEFFSAHALRGMMTLIRRVRNQYNPHLIYRILITMQDKRNRIHRHLTEQIRATFGEGLFETIIQIDTQLRESAVVGTPITHYRSKSRSAEQYRELAQEIIQNVEEKEAAQPAG